MAAYEDLFTYAKHEFNLNKQGKDGKSARYHLEIVSKRIGKTHPDLIPPVDIPAQLIHVWRYFAELDSSRQSGFTINPISHVEIASYCMLTNVKMCSSEVRAIKRLDRLKIEAMQ